MMTGSLRELRRRRHIGSSMLILDQALLCVDRSISEV
jgi:hypothetical protein